MAKKRIAIKEPVQKKGAPGQTVRCLYDEMVPIAKLVPHPKNANDHPPGQVDALAKILTFQGWRAPIKVSKRSGFITAGHGRLLAAQQLGWDSVPVNFQEYDSEAMEFADIQADNAIAQWAVLNLEKMATDVIDFGPDFDFAMLGLTDEKLKAITGAVVPGIDMPDLAEGEKKTPSTMTFTVSADQKNDIERAIELAKQMGPFVDTDNENNNGNALARVAEMFLGQNDVG